jgi:hypothetical protein
MGNTANTAAAKIATSRTIATVALQCATTPEQVEAAKNRLAELEIAEQYFTNPEFRQALEAYTFEMNQVVAC